MRRAEEYLEGLLCAEKSNMESMEEVVCDSNQQALHYLINDAHWDHAAVFSDLAQEADRCLGGSKRSCLLIDETAFAKKGSFSCGVSRQYNGRLGKVDNCQVGVFAALCRDDHVVPVDARLYLPESWIESAYLLGRTKVPKTERRFCNKVEIAIAQVRHALSLGLRFAWVAVDGGYGKNPHFHREMVALDQTYVADVHSSQQVFLSDPEPMATASGRYRSPVSPIRVDSWLEEQGHTPWTYINVRNGVKGPIRVRCKRCRVWLWTEAEQAARKVTLVVTQMPDGTDTKYSVTNAHHNIPTKRLVYCQRQRFWIEQSFRDGKGQVGLHEYQVRSWHGWHRHMAFCTMALLFMLNLRLENKDGLPLLTAHDARDLLAAQFMQVYSGKVDEDALDRMLYNRHKRRLRDIVKSYEKQGLPIPSQFLPEMTE